MRVASGLSEEARAFVFLLCSTCVSHPVNARGIRHFSNYSFNVELALLSRRSNSRSVGIDDVRYTDSDTLCSLNSNRSSRRNSSCSHTHPMPKDLLHLYQLKFASANRLRDSDCARQ